MLMWFNKNKLSIISFVRSNSWTMIKDEPDQRVARFEMEKRLRVRIFIHFYKHHKKRWTTFWVNEPERDGIGRRLRVCGLSLSLSRQWNRTWMERDHVFIVVECLERIVPSFAKDVSHNRENKGDRWQKTTSFSTCILFLFPTFYFIISFYWLFDGSLDGTRSLRPILSSLQKPS